MKKAISLLLAAVLLLGMLPVAALAAGTQPESDSNGVYQIGTAEELLWFAETVNGGNTGISGVLTADIDLSATTTWPGIGLVNKSFSGSFDGQGHTVIFKDAAVGLFGYIKGSKNAVATVQNVITAGSIKNSGFAMEAGFVHFKNCINRATITYFASRVAGLVGIVIGDTEAGILKSDVHFTNCGNEASVSAGGSNVGGILGYTTTNTRLNGCYNTGKIHGGSHVGGLVGYMQEANGTCEIKYSYNTGTVTGSSEVGGILGNMYNGVSIANCYNAGAAFYAIAGNRYNNTATITNSYFLGIKSAKVSPDYNQTQGIDETTTEIATRATAMSASQMASSECAQLLGDSFKQSCPTPVLSWQEAVAHTGAVCDNCDLGSTEAEVYEVSFQSHNGYTISGEEKATQGSSYTFAVTLSEGYERATDFAVKVNGELLTPASDGKYTVLNVDGPLSVTVLGVQVIPGSHAIQLPANGYGYRTNGEKTVARDEDYTFTISFVNGFRAAEDFKVIAQQILSQELLDEGYKPEEILLTEQDGTYTIPTVQKDYRILVSGLEVVSQTNPVEVNFSITAGHDYFHVDPKNENEMLDRVISVPYFDLSLYGLEKYYYNPYCYKDEDGNIRGIQQKGTPESAYDNITVMHAFIVATEMFYLGYDYEDVGTGLSCREMITVTDHKGEQVTVSKFANAVSWSQDAGSSFMNMWDHGTNLNYYVNYEYPLAYPEWGSTSDQILIEDGDVISIHMITGNASGSRFGFFVVNDTDKEFTSDDIVDAYEVDQGEKVKLTLYWTSAKPDYTTGYEQMGGKELYWIEEGNYAPTKHHYEEKDHLGLDVKEWNRTDFGGTTAAKLVTDSKGNVTISTVGLEPGTYYLAALGGFTETGGMNASGSTTGTGTSGGEAGPAVFKLIVNEYEGKLGDVNNDTQITGIDAAKIAQYVAKLTSDVNESVADVNGDGVVTGLDAALISQYIAKLIDVFPAEQKN